MRLSVRYGLLRFCCVAALGASAVLVVDGLRKHPAFCSLESACDKARSSAVGSLFGVPTSWVGLGAFGLLFLLALLPARFGSRPVRLGALVAGVAGLAFVAYQGLVLKSWCPFCLVADGAAVVAALVALGLPRKIPKTKKGSATGRRMPWVTLALAAVAVPWFLGRIAPDQPPPPEAVRGLARVGELSVVEFLNPFCSHCRTTHGRLDRVLAGVAIPVRRTRVYVWHQKTPPLWARALACAEAEGKEDALFRELSASDDLAGHPETVESAVRRAGLDLAAFDACAKGPGPWPRLEHDRALVLGSDLEGLPTIWVGDRAIFGEQDEDDIRDLVDGQVEKLREK